MVMSIRKTTYIHKSRSNKKELPSAVDDAADVMSKYSKNKRKNTSLKKIIFPSNRLWETPSLLSYLFDKKFLNKKGANKPLFFNWVDFFRSDHYS